MEPAAVSLAHSGHTFAVGTIQGTISIVDANSRVQTTVMHSHTKVSSLKGLCQETILPFRNTNLCSCQCITSVSVHNEYQQFVTMASDKTIRLWDVVR